MGRRDPPPFRFDTHTLVTLILFGGLTGGILYLVDISAPVVDGTVLFAALLLAWRIGRDSR